MTPPPAAPVEMGMWRKLLLLKWSLGSSTDVEEAYQWSKASHVVNVAGTDQSVLKDATDCGEVWIAWSWLWNYSELFGTADLQSSICY